MSGVAAIVPAAGLSTRMGRPKLLLPFGGEPLIVRVVNALRQGGAAPVVVVIGIGSLADLIAWNERHKAEECASFLRGNGQFMQVEVQDLSANA